MTENNETEMLRVILCKPGETAEAIEIEDDLESMQEMVGGLIQEYMPFHSETDPRYDDVAIICNEEGKLRSLELNRVITNEIIAGTFFITGQHKGETISLSRKQIRKYKKRFKLENDRNIIEFVKGTVGNSEKLLYYNMKGIGKAIKFRA